MFVELVIIMFAFIYFLIHLCNKFNRYINIMQCKFYEKIIGRKVILSLIEHPLYLFKQIQYFK